LVAVVVSGLAGCASVRTPPRKPLNVLFIAVDDLRPQLLSYGVPGMRSPSVDRLSRDGATFLRSYCQQALCNPSRASVLTGRRPDSIDVHSLETHFRKARPNIVTMPQYFKQRGYHTRALGKVFHRGFDDPASWSEPSWYPTAPTYGDPQIERRLDEASAHADDAIRTTVDAQTGITLESHVNYLKIPFGPSWEAPDVADDALMDGATAVKATQVVAELARSGKPFFLAVGFSRPHLPMVAPRRYFDLYPPESVTLAANPFPPANAADIALTNSWELRLYADIPKRGPIPDDVARNLIRAYMASTSYIDAQIGRVVAALDAAGLRERTIIVVWGDHGFHLGEHGIWCKGTNFEVAARSPMVIVAPGVKPGSRIDALVEFVDIYPTLVDLAGLPMPSEFEGVSLVTLMREPSRRWKSAAFTQHPRGKFMGRSIRTDRYRYTEWTAPNETTQRELYDHAVDDGENVNIADDPNNAALVKELSAKLHAGWRAALPPKE
jgi:arylsulfatase A-like enzyme